MSKIKIDLISRNADWDASVTVDAATREQAERLALKCMANPDAWRIVGLETMLAVGDKVRFKRAVQVFTEDAKRPGERHYKGTIEVGNFGTIFEVDNDRLYVVEVRGGYRIFAHFDDLERA